MLWFGGNIMIKKLTKDNFETEVKTGLKLVEFFAPWCGYCQKMQPELEALDKIWIGQVNTDEEAQLAIRLGVHSFPTFVVFKNGKEIDRFSGYRKKDELLNYLMKYLN